MKPKFHVDGQQDPVARMHKDTLYSSSSEYRVHTGPGLDQLVGGVTNFGAWSADRIPLGKVGTRRQVLRDGEWTVIQDGLGELTGESVGVGTKLRGDS